MNDGVGKSPRLSAACLNIMAKFVHLARQQENADLHLQDKDILSKIRVIALTTRNDQLRKLYRRLEDELITVMPDDIKNKVTHEVSYKPSLFGSLIKEIARSFR